MEDLDSSGNHKPSVEEVAGCGSDFLGDGNPRNQTSDWGNKKMQKIKSEYFSF